MKKLFCLIFLFFLFINVNADTAKISSQRLVKASVAQNMIISIINEEIEDFIKWGFDINIMNYDGNPKKWETYITNLTINNRTWYRSDIGAIYCTLLLSNTSRKYAVYTYITKGDYYRNSSELINMEYLVNVIEIIGFGNPNYGFGNPYF